VDDLPNLAYPFIDRCTQRGDVAVSENAIAILPNLAGSTQLASPLAPELPMGCVARFAALREAIASGGTEVKSSRDEPMVEFSLTAAALTRRGHATGHGSCQRKRQQLPCASDNNSLACGQG
jgi:hypothetical protein